MKNLEDYSAKPVCPSSYLTRLYMELSKRGKFEKTVCGNEKNSIFKMKTQN